MSETLADGQTPPRRGRTTWWIVTIVLALALLGALIALQLREADVQVRQVPSTVIPEPTAEMLAEVERLDAESAELTAELTALLRFVAAYECPPGTAPEDVQRLEDLKRKAEAMLAGAPAPVVLDPAFRTDATSGGEAPSALSASGQISPRATAELSGLLERAVVFVLPLKDSRLIGSGTGFFIAPDLIVTNRHVIENSDPSTVAITNSVLGEVIKARIVARSIKGKAGDPDFALLRTERKVAPATLSLTPQHGKLTAVLAAGYPGMALGSDAGFLALISGDLSSAPDMHQNRGEIRSTQDLGHGTAILHTADVQTGYSGGPLIDHCGRVVGINTFIQVDSSQSAKFNSALAAPGIHGFLRQYNAPHDYDNAQCLTK